MRININFLWVMGGFFLVAGITYTTWSLISYGRVEWVGTIGFALAVLMSSLIGFYLERSLKAQGGLLPEDRVDASIDDGDPELGEFSPWSWWPLILAGSGAMLFLGLAVGIWMVFIAASLFVIAIVGWVYEYYRGYFAH